jgi:hypothetical protein
MGTGRSIPGEETYPLEKLSWHRLTLVQPMVNLNASIMTLYVLLYQNSRGTGKKYLIVV